MDNDPTTTQNGVEALNLLLEALEIPLTLDSPVDLTPSLLIAILESILQERLPLQPEIRNARGFADKVEAMKVFLGVLSDDVIKANVGLTELDPRKLAEGGWNETVYVGQLLVWLAGQLGILEAGPAPDDTWSTLDMTSIHALSLRRSTANIHPFDATTEDEESVATTELAEDFGDPFDHLDPGPSSTLVPGRRSPFVSSPLSQYRIDNHPNQTSEPVSFTFPRPSPTRPSPSPQLKTPDISISEHSTCHCCDVTGDTSMTCTCISNTDDDEDTECDPGPSTCQSRREASSRTPRASSRLSDDILTSPPTKLPTPRRSGWIAPVEGDIDEFETKHPPRTPSRSFISGRSLRPSSSPINPHATRHTSPTQHALALLHERARLLEELARLEIAPSPGRRTLDLSPSHDSFGHRRA